jgi:hypothetical protein
LTEAIEKTEISMEIILCSLVTINLYDDDVAKIDDKVHNEINTLFLSFMNLIDDSSMKSVELGDNPSMELDVIPLDSLIPSTCYIEQDWEANDLLVG